MRRRGGRVAEQPRRDLSLDRPVPIDCELIGQSRLTRAAAVTSVAYVIEADATFYGRAYHRFMRANRWKRLLSFFRVTGFFFVAALALSLANGSEILAKSLAVAGCGAGAAYVLLQPLYGWLFLHRLKKTPAFGRVSDIIVNEDGVNGTDGIHEVKIRWEGITSVVEFSDGLLCLHGPPRSAGCRTLRSSHPRLRVKASKS